MAKEIIMPKMGQTVESCQLLEWLVKKGEPVEQGDPVFSIETDKASFDIEAPASGILKEVFFEAGSDVPVMMVIGIIGDADEDTSGYAPVIFGETPPARDTEPKPEPEKTPEPQAEQPDLPVAERVFISPRAKKLAQEKGVDYTQIQGSGPNDRIKEADVLAYLETQPKLTSLAKEYVKEGLTPPQTAGSGVGARVTADDLAVGKPVEREAEEEEAIRIPVAGPRKIIAQKMFESLTQTAQLTLTTTVDASALQDVRETFNASSDALTMPRITYNDMLHFAVSRVLMQHRSLNAFFSWDEIVMPGAVHLAFAVDTERGLLVPVIRNAHRKSLAQLATEAKALADQAKSGKISPDDLDGGTFTVTNLGQLGVEQFTPVLNPPQVGILGIGAITRQPVDTEFGIEFQPRLHLSLTIDHRAVDGAPGARFLQALKTGLEHFTALLSL